MTGSHPYASIIFGIIFTIIIAIVVWFESKEMKTSVITFSSGLGVTMIGVFILNLIGFYG